MPINSVGFMVLLVTVVPGWVPAMENPNLFEGDMILRPDQIEKYYKGDLGYGSKKNRDELWPNGIIPYIISGELSSNPKAMRSINEAFAEYRKYTCITFKKRTNEREYVKFYEGGGCSSWVGRDTRIHSGEHKISLSNGCWWKTTVMHEIGHSLGFYHEQSRPDRDNYIEVLFNNMSPGASFQFQKQSYSKVDSLGTPYDYQSMMHYNWNAFGRKSGDFGLQTIRTKDRSKQWLLGQRDGFSKIDVIQINKLYRCGNKYPSPPDPEVLPNDACHDMQSCAQGKAEGRCTARSWQYWMKKACRFTCGFCKVTGTGTGTGTETGAGTGTGTGTGNSSCKDIAVNCSKYVSKCRDSSPAWETFMKRSCRKTCRFCKSDSY